MHPTGRALGNVRILVVDDEPQLRRALRTGLGGRGREVETSGEGADALTRLAVESFDLVILDLILPGMGGEEVLRRLRAFSEVGVIVLSGRSTEADKVRLLGLGADDYLGKPFTMGELGARIDAVLRRTHSEGDDSPLLSFGELEVDLARCLVVLDGTAVPFTKTEYRLLEALVTHPRELLTQQWLLRAVWGTGYGQESEYLRTFVAQLRRKLGDDASRPRWIETVPRVGYRWLAVPSVPSPPAEGR